MTLSTRVRYFSLFLFSTLGLCACIAPASAAIPTVATAKIGAGNTVVVTYSEPVNSQISDYTNFTGVLSGRNIVSFSGSGTNAITLTFDGGTFPGDATGGLTIASSTASISDNSNFISVPISVTDGQSPFLTALTISSNSTNSSFLKAGDTISVSFVTNKSITNPIVTINGNSIPVNGSGSGSFTSSYVATSNDVAGLLPITISFTDNAGNTASKTTFALGSGSGLPPSISSITSDAGNTGILRVGNTITFTLTPSVPAPADRVNASYNGTQLSWVTNNNGSTFTATYTVTQGNPDQSSPVQLNGATLIDSAGNTSPVSSGYDVRKTIDANPPLVVEEAKIPTPSTNTPSYSFSTNEAGTISYAGDCSSPTTEASPGSNTIVMNTLSDGFHGNCTLTITDTARNTSNPLTISSFIVNSGSTVSEPAVPAVAAPSPVAVATTPTFTYKFTRNLSVGLSGADVRQLQQELIAFGFMKGPTTGIYGSITQAAVKKYQTKNGLSAVGVVGPATRALLNR